MFSLSYILYGGHTFIETAAFLTIFPKGAYPTESSEEKKFIKDVGKDEGPKIKNRKRVHALALGSLAIMGASTLLRGKVDTVEGLWTSVALGFFHVGASVLDAFAPKVTYVVHYPFAFGFVLHVVMRARQ
uniref:Uncharacterized protein n=1 Tax=Chromera velia CCMP2878 TaxID=1169474 RepID=A0A0G4GZT9_9ALVE|eukprot:Cvel_24118.t1-p1 / transcript=Cvel_24118.t1 / gene=Cvel_24118 / organism=Chromera_velia_CCMP2878 / gene_product=hypothetical protein / transcript_product=hypothetical protein / location=Cvel_scaffold2569:21131-21517(-) / protein_length=129 / sequence_SO=supercontig / SO=protein_coding / is_pseudo=false